MRLSSTMRFYTGSIYFLLILHCSAGSCFRRRRPRENKVVEEFKVEEFGCTFDNKDYYTPPLRESLSVYESRYQSILFTVKPLLFKSVKDFEVLLKNIEKEFSKANEEFVVNSFPMTLDFYDKVEENSYSLNGEDTKFLEFFNGYVPKFFPDDHDSGIAIKLLKRLFQYNKKLSKSVHLVSCSTVVEDKLLKYLDIQTNGTGRFQNDSKTNERIIRPPPPGMFENSHVAALLRFQIKGRLGYVLMDLGFGFDKPVVIMQDGGVLESQSSDLPRRFGKVQWSFDLPRHDYVLAKTTRTEFPSLGDEANEPRTVLYYIGKAYCSFLMTTIKYSLMKTEVSIIRRDANGSTTASISFDLQQKYRMPTYKFSISDGNNVMTDLISMASRKVSVNNRIPPTQDQVDFHNKVIKKINSPGLEELLDKADLIGTSGHFMIYMSFLYEFNERVRKQYLKRYS